MSKNLILASASPRRKEILDTAGYRYTVIVSNADELTEHGDACELVRLNALAKAREVLARVSGDCVVLGADTVVCFNGKILGKPKDADDARAMLRSLSGNTHEVISGYAVVDGEHEESGFCRTLVKFRELTDGEINAYLATSEPYDKAGAYAVQEMASVFVEYVNGDFFSIIGLPVVNVYTALKNFGISPDWQ